MTESLTINGQDILTCGRTFTADLGPLVSVPPKRTANIAVPGRQGLVTVPRKVYDRTQITISVWVRGINPDGSFPSGDRGIQFYKNIDTLLAMFAGTVTLVHTLPDGSVRQITGEVLQAVALTRNAWSINDTSNFGVIIECASVFWREPSTTTATVTAPNASPVTTTLAGFAGCTAPVEDAVVTFTGPCVNPILTAGPWFVQYNETLTTGQSVTIDCGQWTIAVVGATLSYAALVHAGIGPWFVLPPPVAGSGPSVTYQHNGATSSVCTVAAQRAFLGG
jgi:hypothetical protein